MKSYRDNKHSLYSLEPHSIENVTKTKKRLGVLGNFGKVLKSMGEFWESLRKIWKVLGEFGRVWESLGEFE